jgi:hypothetical protein
MNKITSTLVFDIHTYNLEEFGLDSFKEFMSDSFKKGLSHSLCLMLKFKDKSNEVFIYKLDFENSEYKIFNTNCDIQSIYTI